MKKINLQGITPATWTRIVFLLLALINQVAVSIFGADLPVFDDQANYENISTVITIVASVLAGWKNNSVTDKAQKADKVLKGEGK